jgi:UDP-glucose 4-epimerase
MRVLVTGGGAFIGSHVAEELLSRGDEVAVVDDLSGGRRKNVPDGAHFYEMDIRSGCDGAFEAFVPKRSPIRPPRWTFGARSSSRTSTRR